MEARHLPRPPIRPFARMIYITFIVYKALYSRVSGHPRNHPVTQHITGLPFHRLGTPGPEMANSPPRSPDSKTSTPPGHQAHCGPLRYRMIGRLQMPLS